MHRFLAASAAALPLALAFAQGAPPQPATAAPMASNGTGSTAPRAVPAYRSPFEGYRPFSEEPVAKDWRRANDEVREAGGHIGLMKGQAAQQQGHGSHGAHGAKAPAAPPAERK